MRRALPALLASALLLLVPAVAESAAPWPPTDGSGRLFIHYGEEHWNDDDGLTLLPKVVADSIRFKPSMVTMSGDKVNDGTVEQLTRWRTIMEAYDRAGIPYFAAVGNHDRDSLQTVVSGAPPPGSIEPYKGVFAGRPYPMGDKGAPANDPPGASTHYYVDRGNTRWVFIDNSCWVIALCDGFQNPSAQNAEGRPQFEWLADVAGSAGRAGKVVFVVMHMPTQDLADQSYRDLTARNHVMGKGATADNNTFERVAEGAGVDGVFVAHIKGQFLYRGRGNIPYYIDGGAGGELYTTGPVGVDHGFWHGFRLVRVNGSRIRTDAVPIFVQGGIRVTGPAQLAAGRTGLFSAFGKQPVFKNSAKVEGLELRDPAPVARQGSALAGALRTGGWLLIPLGALLFAAAASRAPRRRPALAVPAVALLGVLAVATVAVGQQSEPTSTRKENLPNPSRIWTTGDRFVLAPVASSSEDPRRDPRTQTHDGRFRARCPGRTRISIRSGVESATRPVTVPSQPGRIVRRTRFRKRSLKRGSRRRVLRVRLAQPAELSVRVRRRGRTIRRLARGCYPPGRRLSFFWDGRRLRDGRLRKVKRGRYRIELRMHSDRKTRLRARRLRVR